MPNQVSAILEEALHRKGWTVTKAARECGVERTFLSRLKNGHTPPKRRGAGHRSNADSRYRRLADGLALENPEAFLDAVFSERGGGMPPSLSDAESPTEILASRLWRERLKDLIPFQFKADLSVILREFLELGGAPEKLRAHRLKLFERFEALSYTTGVPGRAPSETRITGMAPGDEPGTEALDLARTKLSRVLEGVGDLILESRESIPGKASVAELFFVLASRSLPNLSEVRRLLDEDDQLPTQTARR